MGLFVGPLTDVSPEDAESFIGDDDLVEVRVTAPKDMKPEIAEAFRWLEKSMSHLLRGNYRAAIEFAADAVNKVAISEGLHGYASY